MLIIDHQALVVISREPGVCDSGTSQRRPAARNAIDSGSIKVRLKITEFPEYNGF